MATTSSFPALSFSRPSKMPGLSFGLPAGRSCPGRAASLRAKNSVCARCYAKKGFYPTRTVREPRDRNLSTIRRYLRHGGPRTLARALLRDGIRNLSPRDWESAGPSGPPCLFVRIHDSGDVFCRSYGFALARAARIAHRLARRRGVKLHLWAPTKAHVVGALRPALSAMARAGIIVRPSAGAVDGPVPHMVGLAGGMGVFSRGNAPSTLVPGTFVCPVRHDPGSPRACREAGCRACWLWPEARIWFEVH